MVLHYSQAASRVGVCGPVHSITTLPIGFEQPVGKNNGNYHTVSLSFLGEMKALVPI